MTFDVTIPVNTTAKIHLPALDKSMIKEGGKFLNEARGVEVMSSSSDETIIKAGSGIYVFTVSGK